MAYSRYTSERYGAEGSMSQHFTAEFIESRRAFGLTRYTVGEVLAAQADLESAEVEYQKAIDTAWPIYTPSDERDRWAGWWRYLPEPMARLYNVTNDTDSVRFDRGGSGNEAFPLGVWKQNAAKFRRQTRRIRRAIQEATAEAVA